MARGGGTTPVMTAISTLDAILGDRAAAVVELYAKWPDAGFHRRLLQLEWSHLRKHPLNPLPMFRF